MTISYNHDVATGKGFGNFWKLLGRWKGSIYKVVIPELIIYAILYTIMSIIYRFWIEEHPYPKEVFEKWIKYCEEFSGMIPVSFILGFYISQIVVRWWNQFMTIPWPDALAALVVSTLHGKNGDIYDETSRLMRRTIMRYANLSFILTMCMISPQAKARFPTMDHLVEAGFMLSHEKVIFDELSKKTDLPKYWIPLVWAGNIVSRARQENRIREDLTLINILAALAKIRSGCGDLLGYDWVCIPLIYTQVATLSVYMYFVAGLFSKQFVTDEVRMDIYVPVFLFLEFFFYTGWLKVAETMINPFGKDEDDFEVNWLIDRNVTISFMIVDEMKEDFPKMFHDRWYEEVVPSSLPYSRAAIQFKTDTHHGSANEDKPIDGEEANFETDKAKSRGKGQVNVNPNDPQRSRSRPRGPPQRNTHPHRFFSAFTAAEYGHDGHYMDAPPQGQEPQEGGLGSNIVRGTVSAVPNIASAWSPFDAKEKAWRDHQKYEL